MSTDLDFSLLGITTVQWNRSDLTTALISDLDDCPGLELVICDNGSSQQQWDQLRQYIVQGNRPLNIGLVRNDVNSGFASGMNLAIRELMKKEVKWLWLLNNDIRISKHALKSLVSIIKELQPGMYGTMIESESTGLSEFGGMKFNTITTRYRTISSSEAAQMNTPGGEYYINGASMLIHRQVIDRIGYLDQDYFLYFEELDYAHRLHKDGYQQSVLEKIEVTHGGAGSSTGNFELEVMKVYNETFSMLRYYWQHLKLMLPWLLLIRMPTRILLLLFSPRYRLAPAVISGISDFFHGGNRYSNPPRVASQEWFNRDC